MATETNITGILTSFVSATDLALSGLPDSQTLLPPSNGITLLDAKNEIFLSYLQALALRNLNVIRSLKSGVDATSTQKLSDDLTKKLVQHRVYLERGVRPLEQKIKYQVDTILRAAEDEERRKGQIEAAKIRAKKDELERGKDEETSEDDSEDEEEPDESAFRANAAGVVQNSKEKSVGVDRGVKSKQDGIYRPPRISATLMPTTETKEKRIRERKMHSTTMDEYVNTEMSVAPLAEPSIGSNIAAGGRSSKDRRQLAKEQERRDYEETNLVRLPKESKKEMAKVRARGTNGFGGEEWADLGNSLNRIAEVTKRKGGRESVLDKSRKRRSAEDGPRGSGIGEAFDVKRRRTLKKMAGR